VWRGQVLGPVREVGAVEVVLADTAMQTDEVRPAVMMISRVPMNRYERMNRGLDPICKSLAGGVACMACPSEVVSLKDEHHLLCIISGYRQYSGDRPG
jgi:hypothetical protein